MASAAEGYITDVSYIPGFYPNMAPVAMRYVATLNRVKPPAVSQGFRYLELGCGLGRALTTLAAANPRGEFVGIDVNPDHTAAVEKDVAAGQLSNARVLKADFRQLPDDLGQFEFIALHGVFSWVSQEVRDHILALAKERLAPGGLLLVSYNALPGWAHLQPIRGILRHYAALRQGDSLQRMRDALAYLVYIRDKQAKYFIDNPRAAAYVDGLLKQDVRYLAHEYLNEHWTSFYFSDVAGMFGSAGLAFVGSLPVFTNFWDLCVRPEFQELFRTTSNRLVTEAHKDFCANTAFRWDVYAKAPQVMPELVDRLREADDLCFHVSRPGITLPYQVNLGVVTSTVQGPVYQALLQALSSGGMRLSELAAVKELAGTPPADLARAVDAGVAMGLFDVSSGPVSSLEDGLSGRVTVPSAFNRSILASDALGGRPVALASITTGTGHSLGDFDAAILHELVEAGADGLTARVDGRLASSGRSLQKDGKAVADAAERLQLVEQACEAFMKTSLPQLVRLGIVMPA
jgi:SAM-dependent methyltransferase